MGQPSVPPIDRAAAGAPHGVAAHACVRRAWLQPPARHAEPATPCGPAPAAARTKGIYDLYGYKQLKAGVEGACSELTSRTGRARMQPLPALVQPLPAAGAAQRATSPTTVYAQPPTLQPRFVAGDAPHYFNITEGPKAVFARFFGTSNPYEALEGAAGRCTVATLRRGRDSTGREAGAACCCAVRQRHPVWQLQG